MVDQSFGNQSRPTSSQLDNILDIREHDVPYHVRVAIDSKINVGHWYEVKGHGSDSPEIKIIEDQPDRPVRPATHNSHVSIPILSYPGTSGTGI